MKIDTSNLNDNSIFIPKRTSTVAGSFVNNPELLKGLLFETPSNNKKHTKVNSTLTVEKGRPHKASTISNN